MGNKQRICGIARGLAICILALGFSSGFLAAANAQSGTIKPTCDVNQMTHYATKGRAFMNTANWSDATYAFAAAFASMGTCRSNIPPIWGLYLNAMLAQSYYNLSNYQAALSSVSAGQQWRATVYVAGLNKTDAGVFTNSSATLDQISKLVADAASRPPVTVQVAPNYGSSGGATRSSSEPGVGMITTTRSGCDYFVVDTQGGYAVLEWYGGWVPSRDDVLRGSFETYGFHDIYDQTGRSSMHVWTDEFWLSSSDAYEKVNENC